MKTIFVLVAFILSLPGTNLFPAAKQNTQRVSPPGAGSRSQWAGIDCTDLLGQIDADWDGFITRDEWDRFFASRDEDNDRKLSPEEIKPKSAEAANEQASGPDDGRLAAFARLDANQNGAIDFSEWPGKEKDFRYLDSDHNGSLSREEFLSRNGRWWNEPFENLDFNGDGLINRKEWLDSESSFERLDRDHNGVVDRREFYNPR